jgi:hypothetical protein
MSDAQEVHLRCHAASQCAAINEIRVSVQRLSTAQLQLSYQVSGDISQLRIQAPTEPERRDELWRHTCAELFVAEADIPAYAEFNLSPSSCWAAYEFDDYRQGMQAANVMPPVITLMQTEQLLIVNARVQLPERHATATVLQASVTMVIESNIGEYSYWAAQHVTVKPDFHCRDSFVLSI